jgi:hypothetical protein
VAAHQPHQILHGALLASGGSIPVMEKEDHVFSEWLGVREGGGIDRLVLKM